MSHQELQTPPDGVAPAPPLAVKMKAYPLDIENVGEDACILMSKGHHDPHEFMRAVRAEGYDWPLGMPVHEWARAIPAPADSGCVCMYVDAKPGARGAFPVTCAREAYGTDQYEAMAANQAGAATKQASS